MTLTEFLLARIAEDADSAKRGRSTGPTVGPRLSGTGMRLSASGFVVLDPARVLAECEAKRWIVSTYLMLLEDIPLQEIGLVTDYLDGDVLRPLAAVYADHPDYDPAWAVSPGLSAPLA